MPARPLRARRPLVALAVLGLVAGAGCRGGQGRGQARLRSEGDVEVRAAGKGWERAGPSTVVKAGSGVRVRTGAATLGLGDGRTVEMRPGSELELARRAAPATGPAVSLVGGDALVVARRASVAATAAGAQVTVVDGAARVAAAGAQAGAAADARPPLVAAYQGSAAVAASGRSVDVPALRQAALGPGGALPERPAPLAYSSSDPWDQRFLGDAIELGDELTARSNGFSGRVGAAGSQSPETLRRLLPGLAGDPAFDPSLLVPTRPAGETLVGTAVAVLGGRGSFASRWTAVFTFRDAGAAWGLVALDQGVARAPLLTTIDAAIARATAPGPAPSPAPSPSIPPPPTVPPTSR
ncbi:MAG: hypothetical protein LC792_02215, partial [Actinobacteria bacterium]|nr:hypothetical protein [Actinomycetota bacterium]